MKSKEPSQGVKTGATTPVSSSGSSVCPKSTPPGNTGNISTTGNSDQISSGAPPNNTTNPGGGGQLKNVGQTPSIDNSDNNSNSDNHCGIGGTLTNPHSVGSSVSGGDRGTPIGTPGIGHPPRYITLDIFLCFSIIYFFHLIYL